MWKKAQTWESSWWGDCVNTLGEEFKQVAYAKRMGLEFYHDGRSPYNIDMEGASVLDIGGGPVSLLLKCTHVLGMVADPLEVPAWVVMRYERAGITFNPTRGEDLKERGWDEVWIYNVLQHTHDPARIIRNAQKAGRIIRLFEWIDTAVNVGHPHSFTAEQLNDWLNGYGKVEQLNGEAGCYGRCYYGIFPTK